MQRHRGMENSAAAPGIVLAVGQGKGGQRGLERGRGQAGKGRGCWPPSFTGRDQLSQQLCAVLNSLILQPDCLRSIPGSSTYQLCPLGQMPQLLCASMSSSANGNNN